MALTEVKIGKTGKPGPKPVKLFDGGDLYLYITPSDGRHWRSAYRFEGKPKTMTFGNFKDITLAEARDLHIDARRLLAKGTDPMAQRRNEKVVVNEAGATFKTVAENWHKTWSSGERMLTMRPGRRAPPDPRHISITGSPADGSDRRTQDCRDDQEDRGSGCQRDRHPIPRQRGPSIPHAIAHELAKRNPAADIKPVDFLKSVPVRNYAASRRTSCPGCYVDRSAQSADRRTRMANRSRTERSVVTVHAT